VVVGDDRFGIEEERAEVVNASAHPETVGALAVAVAAAGPVVDDVRRADHYGAGRDIDTATEAVAAVGPVTARGLVVVDGRIDKRCGAAADVEAAAEALAAVGATFALLATRQVMVERAVEDAEDTGTPNTATRALAGSAPVGTRSAAVGFVVRDRATEDREDRGGAEVGGGDRWPVVEKAAAEAAAPVAASSTRAAAGLVASECAARTVRVAPKVFAMPPPSASAPLPPSAPWPPVAWLSVIVLLLTVVVVPPEPTPLLANPPPMPLPRKEPDALPAPPTARLWRSVTLLSVKMSWVSEGLFSTV
jgi:hypothetical protein